MICKYILGIDPGIQGGISVYSSVQGRISKVFNMPQTPADIYSLLQSILAEVPDDTGIYAFMELVGQGMPGQSSSATAKFARHNGHLDMALYALGIPTTLVTPQKWQKHFSNQLGSSKGLTHTQWKNRLKNLAQRRCPYLSNITLKTADAALIALYGAEIS